MLSLPQEELSPVPVKFLMKLKLKSKLRPTNGLKPLRFRRPRERSLLKLLMHKRNVFSKLRKPPRDIKWNKLERISIARREISNYKEKSLPSGLVKLLLSNKPPLSHALSPRNPRSQLRRQDFWLNAGD